MSESTKRFVFLLDIKGGDNDIWNFIKDRNYTATIKKALRLLEKHENGNSTETKVEAIQNNDDIIKKLDKLIESKYQELNVEQKLDELISTNKKTANLEEKLDEILSILKSKDKIFEDMQKPQQLGTEEQNMFSALMGAGLVGE